MADDVEVRLERMERLLDGLEVIVTRSERLTARMAVDAKRSKEQARVSRAVIDERLEMLDRAFGVVTDRVVGHTSDPEAHQ